MKRRPQIPPTVPEPASDIRAQIAALRDPRNAKDAVFVARGNESALPPGKPNGTKRIARPEGTLVTSNAKKARVFAAGASDDQMARIVEAPQPKSKVDPRTARVIQARDGAGNVVAEAVSSWGAYTKTVAAIRKQKPVGGRVVAMTPIDVLARRLRNGV